MRGRYALGRVTTDVSLQNVGARWMKPHIRRDTHRKVKIALLEADDGRDFSDLIEDLLTTWLSSQRR
jgi:hypothetical protein